MRFGSSEIGWRSLLLSTLLYTGAWGKKDAPGVHYTKLPHVALNLIYFEDSDVVMYEDRVDRVVWRSENAGESWKKVEAAPEGKLLELVLHQYDPKRAYIITSESTHWATKDRGETWEKFFTDYQASIFRPALAFHAGDPDRIIFHAMDCTGIFCEELAMYTTNGFGKTQFLREDTEGCHWAKSSELFTTGQKDLDKDRILCVVRGRFSPWRKDYRLLVSDNFFTSNAGDIQEFEPELEPGRTVKGIVNIAAIKKYLVTAASADKTDEMALYVSDDAIKWHRAVFPHDHKITEEAYTILESTNYSIQIDVMTTRPSNPMGVFFTSNSNGTFFTRNIEHTNRNMDGTVDFEKIAGIQGIVMVNVVDNWEEVETKARSKKDVKSQISFDDGRTWQALRVKKDDLHLHSITDISNFGRVFSSPAPGLIMGNGNTGKFLEPYDKANLYVSDDAGVTWHKALDGSHKYEFGDQGSILVAVHDGHTDEVKYSLNHGKDWESVKLEKKIRPLELVTTQDSTSLKFLMLAVDDSTKDAEYYTIALDFDEMHERTCKDTDMEDWHARVEDGKPTCLMGHTQSYKRRKADAECFIKKEFEDPVPQTVDCDCTDADFECDYNFVRSDDRKECIQKGALVLPEGACKAFGPDDTFMGSSGWRLIPGNTCKRVGKKQKDDPVERKCADAVSGGPASGKGNTTETSFNGGHFVDKLYLERTDASTGSDETVVLRTDKDEIWLSHDHGKKWEQLLKDEKIVRIYSHQYFNDVVFFLTASETVFYSVDRGENIRKFKAPLPPSHDTAVMNFHPKYKDWIIWMGEKCEGTKDCHTVASLTRDRGDKWKTLQRYVKKCEFIGEAPPQRREDKMIYCEVREKENNNADNPLQLVSSADFFDETPKVHFSNVVDFATMSEFIVVATKDNEHNTLKVNTSVDATNFAGAKFPHGFEIDHQKAYTVLDSSTHSVFLHVTVNNDEGHEYGTIIKSNSNGTSYIMSLNAVDRDTSGYVDFEKMFGLEGVAMVNVVANADSKNYNKEKKKLKTMITHNDGAEWDYIKPPANGGADGKKFGCSGGLDKCSLNIHGYTERSDKSHTFSSRAAIGLMMGVGNVGQYLTEYDKADTFMTSDGGINWKFVKQGTYMWKFGDQGSIVVIVKEDAETKVVYYSLNEGKTWIEYQFSDSNMKVSDLTTVPSDNARNFLLWGTIDGKLTTINLDFSGLTDRQCKLDENNVEGGDYYLWTPKHPKQDDDCLFGHVSQYHRKRPDADCYNGRLIPSMHDIAKNCGCTRRDFECDLNYERQSDGSCVLIKGYLPPDHSLVCKNDPEAVEWLEPTGYRRIPITTCEGGKEFDASTAHPCSGHEDEFNKKHSTSGWTIFFAIIIPFAAAGGIGYWVWRNWTGKFGQIRLGEQSSFNDEAPYIKYPVMFVAGAVAVAQAIPLLASSLWRSASSALGRGSGSSRRFTTRDSFARGRGDYAVVDEDEGELLGEDSDEDA
ncbi:vacuolar sorting targeting PEP1 protein [Rutstroemia sp. NJR-2017a WRK4]|nr:vacuolar sorting targeting PEP1 protein [Rutstroemia sp. NJR-2017a WRK4]